MSTYKDREEITLPGTPDALRTMHELSADMRTVLSRLEAICGSLDRIEHDAKEARRLAEETKARAAHASDAAMRAVREANFATKRVDALVGRVQKVEGNRR